jgi:hypothetical protein
MPDRLMWTDAEVLAAINGLPTTPLEVFERLMQQRIDDLAAAGAVSKRDEDDVFVPPTYQREVEAASRP